MLHIHVSTGVCLEGCRIKEKLRGKRGKLKEEGKEKTNCRSERNNRKVRNNRKKKTPPRNEILAIARKQQDVKVTLQLLF